MPPKKVFNENQNQIIRILFNDRGLNGWTEKDVEKKYAELNGSFTTFKTLKAQFQRIKNLTYSSAEPLLTAPVELNETLETNVIPINEVIQANHHQGDMRYGEHGGNQCSGIVMFSLAYSKLIPCSVWNTDAINQIICDGTKYFDICIRRTGNYQSRYLIVEEVLGEIEVSDTFFVAQFAYGSDFNSTRVNMLQHIQVDLEDFFNSNCDTATLTAADYTYGIIKSSNLLYFVDSHSKDAAGRSVPNGYAGVRVYANINSLTNYLLSINTNTNVFYELAFINVTEQPPEIAMGQNLLVRSFSAISIDEQVIFSPDSSMMQIASSDTEASVTINIGKSNKRKRNRRPCLTLQGEQKRIKTVKTNSLKKNKTSSRLSIDKLRKALERSIETTNQNQIRLEQQKLRTQRNRDAETAQETAIRRQKDRDRHRAVYRPIEETPEERQDRLGLLRQRRLDDRFNKDTYLMASFDPDLPFHHDPEDVPTLYLGGFLLSCEHCQAMYNQYETNSQGRYNTCCEANKIRVPVISVYHPTLVELLKDRKHAIRQNFYENIRQYNSILAFGGVKTSFDPVNYDNKYRNRRGFLYKCHGAMYFNFPPLFNDPSDTHPPQTAQFYVMDSDTAHLQRTNAWRNDNGLINDQLLRSLESMISEVNIFSTFFHNHKEELRRQLQTAPEECRMWLTRATLNLDSERAVARQAVLNGNQVAGEIAAVFADNDGNPPDGMKIAIYPRKGHRQLINIRDSNVDPMCMPLMFPYGEAGYDFNIQHTRIATNNRTTMKEFYKHRLHFRKDNQNLYFKFGKLFQEYVVQSWIKIESNNLNWVRCNQNKLKLTNYKGLMGHRSTMYTPENIDKGIGQAFILPSTVPGSDRNMKANYYDAMEIANKHGLGDYFITFTANPHWKEIQDELPEGVSYLDRPDICSRVFEMKLQQFIKKITKDHVMGVMKAYVITREYQKRGLPHAHCVFWLDDQNKLNSAEDIDRFIRADIPDPVTEPRLYALVTKYMMHGPCTPDRPCMQKNGVSCSKGYPKPFCETTTFVPGKFPQYRRPDNGRFVMVKGHRLTNQHVVPYNPYLLELFECHCNVEWCATLFAIAYIMKYVCKGNDRVAVEFDAPVEPDNAVVNNMVMTLADEVPFIDPIVDENMNDNGGQNEPAEEFTLPLHDPEEADIITELQAEDDQIDIHNFIDELPANEDAPITAVPDNFNRGPNFQAYDEIKKYETARYVSAIEACDKIFGFKRIFMSHTIYRLSIHLEDNQPIVFTDDTIEQVAEQVEHRNTMLTGWFELNRTDPSANNMLYMEIPDRYFFCKKTYRWKPRERNEVITRLHWIHPKNQELYHLRMLLLNVRGAQSFADLRTVDEFTFDTFTQAAVAANLVDNDMQWNTCLEEALAIELPHRVRFLFCMISIHCTPVLPNSLNLWLKYKVRMSSDFIDMNQDTEEIACEKSLQHIAYILHQNGKTMRDYHLPEPNPAVEDWRSRNLPAELSELTDLQHAELADAMLDSLNAEQLLIYNQVMIQINNPDNTANKSFFVDGPGGTGKTYLINLLMHKVRSMNLRVIPAAFTGIAASLLDGGQTIHSKFKVPIPTEADSSSRLCVGSPEAQLIRYTKLIIIDEASMLAKNVLECVDRFLRLLRRLPDTPFGGITIVVAGDFRQCLPVSDIARIETPVTMCLKRSILWPAFSQYQLTQNLRALPDEIEFKNWLMDLGNGRLPTIDQVSLIRVPDRVLCENNLIDDIYGTEVMTVEELSSLNVAILCPTNKDSLEINDVILGRLEGNECERLSTTTVEVSGTMQVEDFPIEYALNETPSGYPPHRLLLKVGALVILLKNWSQREGLCNGTRMRVIQIGLHSIRCAILFGPFAGKEYSFCRTLFHPSAQDKSDVKIIRRQFPFRLAFAMTINKSQGQTFDRVGILLRESVFAHGQLYTAASRGISFDRVKILVMTILKGSKIQGEIPGFEGVYTRNIVERSILS